ncbi:MAG: beta-lactamase family protein [Bacteroidetes bacterium]|nr:beta-lactamase family protein [Bacteroidota bacterium]
MKKILVLAILISGCILSNAQNKKTICDLGITINPRFSKAKAIDSIIKKYTDAILPGTAIAVYTEKEGWWTSSSGYANLEEKTPMENCHLQYIQSVSKMYMATEILLLKEKGKIDFDDPMTKYLPVKYSRYIKDAGKITVRMLLNQTSGVPEYNSNPSFVNHVMMHPSDYFTQEDCLKSIGGEELQFVPGSKYRYTNTNYLLLSLIGDALTGNHAAFIQQNILKPLGLKNTYYGLDHNYLRGLNLPQSYWDILAVGRPANFTKLQQVTVASSKGDDGLVCTPVDAVKFLKAIMEGKILKPESLKEMLNFVKDEKGRNRYGMGMIYFDLEGIPAYGHGGGGIGAGCGLLYIPSHKTYVFISTNLGVLVDTETTKKADDLKNEILITLLM